mgnify:CR=1 FL=1|jgi:hypothetical protein
MAMPLHIEEHQYPSGGTYGVFFIGTSEIGRADKMPDGWKVFRKRKTMPTPELAAKVMLEDKLNALRVEEDRVTKLLEGLRLYCGGRLPSSTK